MAEKRMFSKMIIDSDAFLDMPLSTQALYFHISMRADDEGFVNNPKKIQRMIGSSDDDARILIAKNFIIPFESGIVVIRHWRIHNYIRSDRLMETKCTAERAMLDVDDSGAYAFSDGIVEAQKELVSHLPVTCLSPDSHLSGTCQAMDGIDKNSIDKSRLEQNREESKPQKRFSPPSVEEVRAYIAEKGYTHVNADSFVSFYASKNWMVGKNKMVSWHSSVAGWEAREKDKAKPSPQKPQNRFAVQDHANTYDFDDLERQARERQMV